MMTRGTIELFDFYILSNILITSAPGHVGLLNRMRLMALR